MQKVIHRESHLWPRRWARLARAFDELPNEAEEARQSLTGDLHTIPCAVLLGAPGLGKSHEIEVAGQLAASKGEQADLLQLRRFASVSELASAIEKRANSIQQLTGPWHIFLDGLDEALSQLSDVPDAIPSILRSLDRSVGLERIRLRISCRSAEWPPALETSLREFWPGPALQVFELQELSESDVDRAARTLPTNLIEPFFEQVRIREIEPLTKRPVTLVMLLSLFSEENSLPNQRTELYRQSLLKLIETSNRSLEGDETPFAKLALAGRIAAACVFSGSTEIFSGALPQEYDGRAISLNELRDGVERGLQGNFEVDRPRLQQAVLTPLFAHIGDGQFVWAHQTFMEYLAAYYLIEHGLNAEEILDLFVSHGSEQIPPQLHEVAAWVASLSIEFFDALVSREPEILLRSDVASASTESRRALVRALLARFDRAEIHDFGISIRASYGRLNFPGIADHLQPYILAKDKNIVVRRVAIDIAEASQVEELGDLLLERALDKGEVLHIREQAAAAVSRIGGGVDLTKLRPLLEGGDDDPNDELKGFALKCLWPQLLSLHELLSAITPESNRSWYGSYASFLNGIEVSAVSGEQSVEIIHWALTQTVDHEVGRRLARPLSHLLLKAWQCRSEVTLDAFAHFFLQIIKDDRWHTIQSIAKGFLSDVSTSHADRIRLVEKIIQLGNTDSWSWLAAALPVPLVTADDLPWLLNHLAHSDGEFPEAASVQLILAVLSQKDLNDLHDVWVAADSSQRLLTGLESYFSCELESQQSDWLRTELKRRQDREQQKQRQWDEIKRAVESKLTQVFTTSSFSWWELNLGLLADENGQLEEFRSDLTSSTIWAALEANVQVRIVEGATAYLVENRIPSLRWLGTATFNRPAAAAFRAFRLLLDRGLLDRNTFSESVWRKWAACVFTPFNTGSSDSAPLTKIVHLAYEAAPNEMLRAIARVGVKARGRYDLHRAINILDSCFDERIGAVYWSLLKRRYDDERAEELASYLARKAHPKAIQLLVKELKATDATRTLADAVLIAGVSSALINCTREIWSDFYDFSSRNESVALEIVRALARSGRVNDEGFVDRMEEQELAKFYIWTHQKIPPPSEAFRDGPRWVSDDDQVDNVRSAALKRLTDSGSAEAVSAVAFIAAALPDIPWIQYNLLDAKKAATALSWRLWDPSQVVSRIAQYHPLERPRGTKERLATADSERELKLELAINILGDNAIAVSQAISVETSLVNARGILAVATEWRSAHGGLSTLNRELCVALAALGHKVACLVVSCDAEERKEAKLAGVELLSAPTDALPNLNELTRLLLFSPKHLGNFRPDFVIGHDHITGTAARKIAKEDYDVPYVHFVHTLPEEIEKYKNRPDRVHSVIYGSIKAKHQTDQCKGADIVIAVGPRIAKDVQQRLLLEEHIPVFELRPGMNEQLMSKQPKYYEDKPLHCLLMARFEDADLKGAPLACSIIKALNENWGIKRAWTRPKLILRGFTSNAANQEAEQIDGYAEAMDHIVCRPFTQNVSEIATDIFSSAVVVMPSIVEGFGLTALEAIAAGVPTIVSSESGLAQVLMDKKISGAAFAIAEKWVVDVKPSDAKAKEEWAAKVKAILDDPECAHQEAKQLRDALRPHLNWDRAARLLSARLEELTSSTSGQTHTPA